MSALSVEDAMHVSMSLAGPGSIFTDFLSLSYEISTFLFTTVSTYIEVSVASCCFCCCFAFAVDVSGAIYANTQASAISNLLTWFCFGL